MSRLSELRINLASLLSTQRASPVSSEPLGLELVAERLNVEDSGLCGFFLATV